MTVLYQPSTTPAWGEPGHEPWQRDPGFGIPDQQPWNLDPDFSAPGKPWDLDPGFSPGGKRTQRMAGMLALDPLWSRLL